MKALIGVAKWPFLNYLPEMKLFGHLAIFYCCRKRYILRRVFEKLRKIWNI
jgi:hypothetical protein